MQKSKCLICGKSFKRIGPHVAQSHKMTAKDYFDRYLRENSDGKCKICGAPTSFRGINFGYSKYCSSKCSFQDSELVDSIKRTNRERYGVDWVLSSKDIRKKGEKTLIEKYGVDNSLKSKELREKGKKTSLEKWGFEVPSQSPIIKEKTKRTNLERYDCHPSQLSVTKEKMRQTCLEKYGYKAPAGNRGVLEKIKSTNLARYGQEYYFKSKDFELKNLATNQEKYGVDWRLQNEDVRKEILETKKAKVKAAIDKGYITVSEVSKSYGVRWRRELDIPIKKVSDTFLIDKKYVPEIEQFYKDNFFRSEFESNVVDFVSSIYTGELILNDRQQIAPYELDIYIPEKKLAIECDGVYYHSTQKRADRNYHLKKTRMCLDRGIRLIHIDDWEWAKKRQICESIVSGAIGVYRQRLYARECTIKEVSHKESKDFLEANHLQGNVNASYRLGLYFRDELVQIVTLGKSRFKKDELELLRMCTKLNTQVVGGFSKLMSHLPPEFTEVYSFVDRSKFTGASYLKSGWELVSFTKPNYHYFKNFERFTRNQCQKNMLKDFLGEENFDPNLSEVENMFANGFVRTFDCGNVKLVWRKGV